MNKEKTLSFDEEELEIIRELLSAASCGYERETFFYHCCDANEIIEKIDEALGSQILAEDKGLVKLLEETKKAFPTSYINDYNELIFEPENNLYFRLVGVQNEFDFKCKLFSWLSRPICKGLDKHWSKKVLTSFNQLLNTNFSKDEMKVIYTHLGNGTNQELCERFIKENYNLKLLISPKNKVNIDSNQ